MATIKIPDIDVGRLRDALERVDLPDVDIGRRLDRLDLPALDRSRLDLSKIDLPRVDLPDIDLPKVDFDFHRLIGRRSRRSRWDEIGGPGSVMLGLAALAGVIAVGGAMAWLFHPRFGSRRRARLRRRLGLAPTGPSRQSALMRDPTLPTSSVSGGGDIASNAPVVTIDAPEVHPSDQPRAETASS